jgi:S-formylglutathione hydrolase FrmB
MKIIKVALSFSTLTALLACSTTQAESSVPKETIVENGCTIEKYTIFSPSMNRDIRIAVVLPPAYATSPNKNFPILYTLHGYGAPYDTWSQMSTLRQTLADCPMIVTCLDGDKGSWYIDSPLKPKSQFETFFFDEFIPYLDKHYRVDTNSRAVTGFSMGGCGAFQYMLAKPELFKSVSALSGAFWDMNNPTQRNKDHLGPMIGSFDEVPERYAALDLIVGVKNAEKLPPIYLHCGTEDFLLDTNREMKKTLEEKGFDFEYKETEGGHDWKFWKAAATDVIKFHWKHR